MKIKKIFVKGFKRFENLAIDGISQSVKLVILVGSNGSGKTSLFEAFNFLFNVIRQQPALDPSYHIKVGTSIPSVNWQEQFNKIKVETHDNIDLVKEQNTLPGKKRFYFRTAYRHEPDFSVSSINRLGNQDMDLKHPALLTHPEARVSDNYQRIVSETIAEIYRPGSDSMTKNEIKNKIIGKIQSTLKRVLNDITLESLGDPLQNGTFLFTKGISKNFKYKNLSGGEKAAFDLLLDYVLKTESFTDTVFCIDEPEIHMHTKLQAKLLKEMYDLTPENCQLWISTHSIGMIREAQRLYQQFPDKVAFLDFHDLDFDKECIIRPTIPTRNFYKKMFSVAIDELAELVAPEKIYFCEGRCGIDKKNSKPFGFDPRAYRTIFNTIKPEIEFVSLGGDKDVISISKIIDLSFKQLFPTIEFFTILDRDDRSNEDITEAKKNNQRILSRRDLENYLWDDEILTKLCKEKPESGKNIINEKNRLLELNVANDMPIDDVKAISGDLYNFIKKELRLTQCGNDSKSFAITTLAPLITEDTNVFQELSNDLFNK